MGALASIPPNYLGSGFFGGVYSYGAPIGRGDFTPTGDAATAPTASPAASAPNTPVQVQVCALQTQMDQIHARLQALTASATLNIRSVSVEATHIIADLKQILSALQEAGSAPAADIGRTEGDIKVACALETCAASISSGLESQLAQLNGLLAILAGLLGGAATAGSTLRASDPSVNSARTQARQSYRPSGFRAPVSAGLTLSI